MSIFSNLLKSPLKIFVFIVFPLIILFLIGAIFFTIFNNKTDKPTDILTLNSNSSISSDVSVIITTTSSQSQKTSNKSSFEDLDPKISSVSSKSVIAQTSYVASTPEIDIKNINTLLENIENIDYTADQALDDQIVEN